MSRKSRQKKGRKLLQKLPPVWILIPMLIIGLGMGILSVTMPWITPPTPYEDTISVSATLQKVEANYVRHHLHAIHLDFSDHDRLFISPKVAHKALLDKLETYPAGTVFDMHVDDSNVLALSVNGADVLTYEAACKAIKFDNQLGIVVGIFMLAIAAYAAWCLITIWRYRCLT